MVLGISDKQAGNCSRFQDFYIGTDMDDRLIDRLLNDTMEEPLIEEENDKI